MKKILILLLILVPTLGLLWFSLNRDPRALPSTLVGRSAPDFELSSLKGDHRVTLSTIRGKSVVLNFWATWCGSCVMEHQLIREATQAYAGKNIAFYSILYEDTPEKASEFVSQYGEAAPVLLDPELKTAINYGVSGVPETFFIDPQGTILYKHVGALTPEVLSTRLGTLTREGGKIVP